MKQNWIHKATVIDSEPFKIKGMNIWSYDWKYVGKSIKVKDPNYGQSYTFRIYEIIEGTKKVQFAAGGFSNCV
ncbi:hypothetical protein [Mangrovibacterium diazotrophicum]|uniref:Uncharacterized protein n=1 Tax=Mangrovibacterium diazotrophicum TaxID=1261403 RepID=A0A419VUA6_9BACT|nr:hypothetical protein [Mangrovibacterium diazotrophicum]RKD85042.1 hypothetical protein BC643_4561 [Mangrovibacterium diazotrophicum]